MDAEGTLLDTFCETSIVLLLKPEKGIAKIIQVSITITHNIKPKTFNKMLRS